jgi:AcrR family transcriptional regulator
LHDVVRDPLMAKGSRKPSAGESVSAEVVQREATRLFAEHTYPAVGIRDIADAVGLLPGSLYVHITSKEELLFVIVRDGIGRYLDAIGPVTHDEVSAATKLQRGMRAYLAISAAHREQTRVAFHQWTYLRGERREAVMTLRLAYEQLFADITAEGVSTGEFRRPRSQRLAVLTIVGALTAAGEWFRPQGALNLDDVATELADTALRGLCR